MLLCPFFTNVSIILNFAKCIHYTLTHAEWLNPGQLCNDKGVLLVVVLMITLTTEFVMWANTAISCENKHL